MILMLCPMTYTTILAATRKTTAAVLFSRDLHVLLLPKTVNAFVIDVPMSLHQPSMNTVCSKAGTLPG
jgi:hypothetical protein